jgi:hypothetical protein
LQISKVNPDFSFKKEHGTTLFLKIQLSQLTALVQALGSRPGFRILVRIIYCMVDNCSFLCFLSFQKTTSLGNRVDYNRLSFVSDVVVGFLFENGLDRRQKIAQWALSKGNISSLSEEFLK